MLPLGDLPVVVEEGFLLRDEDNRRFWGGEGTELGAAWYAAVFKLCLDARVSRYMSWGHRICGLKTPSYNLISMYQRMEDGARLDLGVTGEKGEWDERYADALAVRSQDGTVRVLVFQFCRDRNLSPIQPVELRVNGLKPGGFTRTHWRIDRDHSNFFTRWLADSAHLKRYNLPAGIETTEWAGSIFDMNVPQSLAESDRGFWFNKVKSYAGHDELERFEPDRPITVNKDGCWKDQIDLSSNSVSLIELIPAVK